LLFAFGNVQYGGVPVGSIYQYFGNSNIIKSPPYSINVLLLHLIFREASVSIVLTENVGA